jgi:hypothetical protein
VRAGEFDQPFSAWEQTNNKAWDGRGERERGPQTSLSLSVLSLSAASIGSAAGDCPIIPRILLTLSVTLPLVMITKNFKSTVKEMVC